MANPTLERITSETTNEHEAIYLLKTAGYDAHPIWRGGGRAYGLQVNMGDKTYQAYVELINGKEKWNIVELAPDR
jgi:hypothetical protein